MRKMASEIVSMCAEKYGFSVEEALNSLDLMKGKGCSRVSSRVSSSKGKSGSKVSSVKHKFPLPYNGEPDSGKCCALRQNCGLYTQCSFDKAEDSAYCKRCLVLSKKTETGIPEYGTIEMRLSCGIQEYVDPKGRKPTLYAKIMKKYKVSREEVEAEASIHGITVSELHFEVAEESKRGRPATKPKEVKEAKGVKGRPRKAEKVIKLNEDSEDLFASLLAEAQAEEEQEDASVAESEASVAESEASVAESEASVEEEDPIVAEEEASVAEQNSTPRERVYTSPSEETLERERSGIKNEDNDIRPLSDENSRSKDVALFQELSKAEKAKEKAAKEKAAKEKAAKEQAKAEKAKEAKEQAKEQAKADKSKANAEVQIKETIEKALTETATIDKTKVQKKMKEHVQKIIQEAKEEKAKAEAKANAEEKSKANAEEKSKANAEEKSKAEEPKTETYKKFTGPNGKKYLRSSESNNVYDFEVYASSQELELVGKWEADTKTIIFKQDDDSESELSDEEIEDEDDD